jgi:hypothetical protein
MGKKVYTIGGEGTSEKKRKNQSDKIQKSATRRSFTRSILNVINVLDYLVSCNISGGNILLTPLLVALCIWKVFSAPESAILTITTVLVALFFVSGLRCLLKFTLAKQYTADKNHPGMIIGGIIGSLVSLIVLWFFLSFTTFGALVRTLYLILGAVFVIIACFSAIKADSFFFKCLSQDRDLRMEVAQEVLRRDPSSVKKASEVFTKYGDMSVRFDGAGFEKTGTYHSRLGGEDYNTRQNATSYTGGLGVGTPNAPSNNTTSSYNNVNNQAAPSAPEKSKKPGMSGKEALNKLNSMIGLGRVKKEVSDMLSLAQAEQQRKKANPNYESTDSGLSHLAFVGNPGTGKTTVARYIGAIYKDMGFLKNDNFVEANRDDLVAGFVGQTAPKTMEVINRAMGGVLFIDEAYNLVHDDRDTFGAESLTTLLKAMEDNHDSFVVIFAGYEREIGEFLKSNSGLKSRVQMIHFDDYDADELLQIFMHIADNAGFSVTEAAQKVLLRSFETIDKIDFGNGRGVRNLFGASKKALSVRTLGETHKKALFTITGEDVMEAVRNTTGIGDGASGDDFFRKNYNFDPGDEGSDET